MRTRIDPDADGVGKAHARANKVRAVPLAIMRLQEDDIVTHGVEVPNVSMIGERN